MYFKRYDDMKKHFQILSDAFQNCVCNCTSMNTLLILSTVPNNATCMQGHAGTTDQMAVVS